MASATGSGPSLPAKATATDAAREQLVDGESFVDRAGTASTVGTALDDDPTPEPVKVVPWYRKEYGGRRKVKPEIIMEFSRQLSSFIEAGIPLIDALEIVGLQADSDVMRDVIGEIRSAILRGASFVAAVAEHPDVFPAYYRAMVRSSGYTGNLDQVLTQLASYLERDITARRQVKSALTYPIIVLIVATAAIIAMALFVLPKFSTLYKNLGARLPLPTRILLGMTDFFTEYWPFLLLLVVAVSTAVYLLYGRSTAKPRRDPLVLKMPVLGELVHIVAIERFCRVLSALATAGVPLPEAIEVAADSTNNTVFQTKLAVVREALVRGGGLSQPITESELFPIAARQMSAVGEKTGMLSVQLGKAASYYEREVSFRIKKATDIFEPMVILFVGGIVGFVAVAQVAAMYSIFSQIKT